MATITINTSGIKITRILTHTVSVFVRLIVSMEQSLSLSLSSSLSHSLSLSTLYSTTMDYNDFKLPLCLRILLVQKLISLSSFLSLSLIFSPLSSWLAPVFQLSYALSLFLSPSLTHVPWNYSERASSIYNLKAIN